MNNFTFGDEGMGYYETIAGGAGAGPGWHGRRCAALGLLPGATAAGRLAAASAAAAVGAAQVRMPLLAAHAPRVSAFSRPARPHRSHP